MNYARTPRELGRQGGKIKVICCANRCTHEAIVSPLELVQMGYGDHALDAIFRHFKCRMCGTGKPTIQVDLWIGK